MQIRPAVRLVYGLIDTAAPPETSLVGVLTLGIPTDDLRPEDIDAELPTPYVDWIELLASLLVAAQEAGELREGVSPQAAARSLVSAFFGAQHISDVLHGRTDVVDRWAETSELLVYAIRAR